MKSVKQPLAAYCAALVLASGCADTNGPDNAVSIPDGKQFLDEVYPVMLRDCAFSTCHGSRDRFLQILGPGRPRLDPESTGVTDPMTLDEVLFSYERARSMLATGVTATRSLLLTKPLEFSAGGQGHRGADDYGRNVFRSKHDPGIQAILRWAYSTGGPPKQADVDAANARAMEAQDQFDEHLSTEQEMQQ
jgi:hypothetical protein